MNIKWPLGRLFFVINDPVAFYCRIPKIDGHEKLQASYCSAYIGIIQNYLAVKAIMSQIYALHKAILANI